MQGSETWPMKVEHEVKLNHTEMSMIRWMCCVKLIDWIGTSQFGDQEE